MSSFPQETYVVTGSRDGGHGDLDLVRHYAAYVSHTMKKDDVEHCI